MKDFLKKFFDIKFWKFILVGIANTLFGAAIMFVFYNVLLKGVQEDWRYWLSSAANYFFGSILSYFLNKYFTFRQKGNTGKSLVRFILNILVCYLLAYGIAKPLITSMLSNASASVQGNVAMVAGMCLFVGLNYIGQRFFVFREADKEDGDKADALQETGAPEQIPDKEETERNED